MYHKLYKRSAEKCQKVFYHFLYAYLNCFCTNLYAFSNNAIFVKDTLEVIGQFNKYN